MVNNSWQSLIRPDSRTTAPAIVIIGPPGVGKTTFGASLPRPVIIDWDRGTRQLQGVRRIPGPGTLRETLSLLDGIIAAPGDLGSVVIDTIDGLEDIIAAELCAAAKVRSLKEIGGGWGKGDDALAAEWRPILVTKLDAIREQGIVVCLLAHAIVRSAKDPMLGEVDSWTAQSAKKTWAQTMRWADVVGFATFDAAKVGDEKRALVTGERILITERASGVEAAKNRYSLPPRMRFGWSELSAAMAAHETDASVVRARIVELAGESFAEKAAEYMRSAGDDVAELLRIETALKEKVQSS